MQRRAAHTPKLRLELYKQSRPATGTVIGPLAGRVIWDSPKPCCCDQPQSAISHSAPGATRLCIRSATGLGVEGPRRLRALASGIASMGPDQKVTLQAWLSGT